MVPRVEPRLALSAMPLSDPVSIQGAMSSQNSEKDNNTRTNTHETPPTSSPAKPPPLPMPPPPVAVQQSVLPSRRPDLAHRSLTDPEPVIRLQNFFLASPPPIPTARVRPRNHSPYSRSHLRSKSSGSLLSAPIMTRAKSMPSPPTTRRVDTLPSHATTLPGSPRRTPPRTRSPFSPTHDLDFTRSPPRSERLDGTAQGVLSNVPTIEEDSELDMTPRQNGQLIHSPFPAASAAFSRSASLRRRPASPLHSANVPTTAIQSSPTSYPVLSEFSPTPMAQRFVNEAYPALHHSTSTSSFSASSIPSTPTSLRSRSPSISSLDTIEDVPDAESAAAENAEIERLERLNAAAETQERLKRAGLEADDDSGSDGGTRRRSSFESGRMGRGLGRISQGTERKRWSICGGERRGDFDLETIWED